MWQKSYNEGVVYSIVNPKRGNCLSFNPIIEKVGASMKISKVHAILLIAMLLFGGVVFSSVLRSAAAQDVIQISIPASIETNSVVTILQVESIG